MGGSAFCWVTCDACGLFCVALVWASIAFIDYATSRFAILPMYSKWEKDPFAYNMTIGDMTDLGKMHFWSFQLIVCMVVWCHVAGSFSDPGFCARDPEGAFLKIYNQRIEEMTQSNDDEGIKRLKRKFCKKCNAPKPQGAHHCSTCGRCVRRLDHHCPWMNNCVGERNIKMFVLFLAYVTLGTGYSMVAFLRRAHFVMNYDRGKGVPQIRSFPHVSRQQQEFHSIWVVCCSTTAFIVALFFFIFVLMMFYDQYEGCTTGTPGVDALQGKWALKENVNVAVGIRRYVCRNHSFSWRWFLPIPESRDANHPRLPPAPNAAASTPHIDGESLDGEAPIVQVDDAKEEDSRAAPSTPSSSSAIEYEVDEAGERKKKEE